LSSIADDIGIWRTRPLTGKLQSATAEPTPMTAHPTSHLTPAANHTDAAPPVRRGLILAAVCLAAFAINIDTTIINVALPSLTRQLHAGTTDL